MMGPSVLWPLSATMHESISKACFPFNIRVCRCIQLFNILLKKTTFLFIKSIIICCSQCKDAKHFGVRRSTWYHSSRHDWFTARRDGHYIKWATSRLGTKENMAHWTSQKSIEDKGISQGNYRFWTPNEAATLTCYISFQILESE